MLNHLFSKIALTAYLFMGMIQYTSAHFHHHSNPIRKVWHVQGKIIEGTFLFAKEDSVFLEQDKQHVIGIPIKKFSSKDQVYFQNKILGIKNLNQKLNTSYPKRHLHFSFPYISMFKGILILITLFLLFILIKQKSTKQVIIISILLGSGSLLLSFTDPNIIRNAFLPFAPNVNTFWDNNYFYVESKGIPTTHEMMVGISDHGWQQQVPIPQCYLGSNAWSIPLNPIMSNSPIPVDQIHFTRGAIAIAVNGVPIFNPHTNTGVDSYLDGQLDNYGGHCGRGDDYHYHIAPLHLYGQTTYNLPIAYAFDGFAVFGNLEPDGANMNALDDNHGHYYNGEYHYHGTSESPYMIAKFAGVVTEDSTHQLIPQAQAHPVRTEYWTPLNGALITHCLPNGLNNGYELQYSLNGVPGYATQYSWNNNIYNFNYIAPTSNSTVNYNGFVQCELPLLISNNSILEEPVIYPNPFKSQLFAANSPSNSQFTIFNSEGNIIYKGHEINEQDFSKLPIGIYFIKSNYSQKIFKLIKE